MRLARTYVIIKQTKHKRLIACITECKNETIIREWRVQSWGPSAFGASSRNLCWGKNWNLRSGGVYETLEVALKGWDLVTNQGY